MNQINDQFAAASRQFAENAAQVNRLALENAEKAFGLQLATFQQNANAAFAFLGEVSQVRDIEGFKSVLPKGAQVARENVERAVSATQEVFGSTLKTNEAIAQLAKGQLESAAAQVQAEVEQATPATAKRK